MNSNAFAEIIVGMMKDYKITMFDALLWDFESTLPISAEELYDSQGVVILENTFRKYLVNNGIKTEKEKTFYSDIFMGRSSNMGLTVVKTDKK